MIPIFIIGAARNGTTQLENTIGSFEQVAHVQHFLHYGSCENNLYFLNRYFGNISKTDQYISSIFEYATSDYFTIAEGNIDHHFSVPRKNIYEVFFDLMDEYARKNDKQYWVTKLDPPYAADKIAFDAFLTSLRNRYKKIKFISIRRNLYDSLLSYLRMEGGKYRSRQKMYNKFPAIFLYTSRYYNIYHNLIFKNNNQQKFLSIRFEDFVESKEITIKRIAQFVGLQKIHIETNKGFQVNTSFVGTKKEEDMFVKRVGSFSYSSFKFFPYLSLWFNKKYIDWQARKKPHTYRRLLKYKYFYNDLIKDLKKSNSLGLLNKLKNENSTINT